GRRRRGSGARLPEQFPPAGPRRRDVHWVEPKTVIEANLRGWTADGLVRQAAFKGVREDKPPREVVPEMPVVTAAAAARPTAPKIAAETAKAMTRTSKTKARASARKPSSGQPEGRKEMRFTHPERVYWADAGVTKQDLADY